ncbi:hypothetical protein Y032_0087g2076 [Ancylostoma ceylanicum]|uniref:Sulfur globule protein CV3 family protein n=1 Tax=Ancylostoma ceylanicum TaxID=53326 RepID=A0A016TPD6_9BILA|nr:hypothetical protein Y032_0087g2076 [Ancylostoma ceylanicum]
MRFLQFLVLLLAVVLTAAFPTSIENQLIRTKRQWGWGSNYYPGGWHGNYRPGWGYRPGGWGGGWGHGHYYPGGFHHG